MLPSTSKLSLIMSLVVSLVIYLVAMEIRYATKYLPVIYSLLNTVITILKMKGDRSVMSIVIDACRLNPARGTFGQVKT